ncbi:MAG: hypothetical protein H8E17_17610 [Deltaproteobacteria bacterium]|nr:hypothetical protein [Deltaproteobacteria bacterium]
MQFRAISAEEVIGVILEILDIGRKALNITIAKGGNDVKIEIPRTGQDLNE